MYFMHNKPLLIKSKIESVIKSIEYLFYCIFCYYKGTIKIIADFLSYVVIKNYVLNKSKDPNNL